MRRFLTLIALLWSALALADAAEDAAKLDALHAKRQDPPVQKEIDAAVEAAVKAYPNDYGILWRAARARFWVADGFTGELEKRTGKEAWDYGARAVKLNAKGIEGQYFTAAGVGAYSQGAGILKALTEGLEGIFNEHLDASIAMDPTYNHCGPLIAKGRYHYELPWPKRDLGKSIQRLSDAIAKCPENIRAYVYLAEAYLKDGDAKKAKEIVDKAPTDVSYDPAEGERALSMMKPVRAQVAK